MTDDTAKAPKKRAKTTRRPRNARTSFSAILRKYAIADDVLVAATARAALAEMLTAEAEELRA